MTQQPVQANDLRALWSEIEDDALEAVRRVGRSGWFVLGSEVATFEQELGRLHGVEHVVGCASGLDAIEIALRAAGIGAGDRVITTPLTAFATALAIERAGAEVCFADVDSSGLIDLGQVESALERDPAIRAVVPVHLYGQSVDIARLGGIAERHDCLVIEDAAQAVCGDADGAPLGSTTVGAATSFYPTKNLGALGDGGALLTNDAQIAEAARQLRDYGQSAKYEHSTLGLNSRLDELHAAILRSALLPRLPRALTRRSQIAQRYLQEIDNPALRMLDPATRSTWHLFPIFTGDPALRDDLQASLGESGIGTAVHYPILASDQQALAGRQFGSFPVAAGLAGSELSLPIHPYLSDPKVDRVIATVNEWKPA